ncbi:unnamed protein product [Rangifer tarandus platyrhynchus]|uniref:Uncharacterized protein n=1 Tax=Rangifer tarandus platyrhynchus TaxID=3082113 RepID=A0AC59Z5E7_RANTA
MTSILLKASASENKQSKKGLSDKKQKTELPSARTPGLTLGTIWKMPAAGSNGPLGREEASPRVKRRPGLPGWGLEALEGSRAVQNFAALLPGVETKRTSSSPGELAEV